MVTSMRKMHLQLREKLWGTNWKAIRIEVGIKIELMNNEFSAAGGGNPYNPGHKMSLTILVFSCTRCWCVSGGEGTS